MMKLCYIFLESYYFITTGTCFTYVDVRGALSARPLTTDQLTVEESPSAQTVIGGRSANHHIAVTSLVCCFTMRPQEGAAHA